jgi:hypothetical protein
MNKQFGYKELQMSFGVLPIKVGMYTIENLLKDYGIGLYDLGSVMEAREVMLDGEMITASIPKDPIKFFRSILLHSANYIPWREGKKLYTEVDAYDWMEEIGFSSPTALEIVALFHTVARSGVAVSNDRTESQTPKKKASQSRSKNSGGRR